MLGHFLFFSGIISLIRLINRSIPRVPILTYHSIANNKYEKPQSIMYLVGMEVPKDTFEKHIEYVAKRYTAIGLDNLVDWLHNKKDLPKNPIVLTFDDGLKNNYDNAFPILQKYNCKATFFLIGNPYSEEKTVWLHLLYRILDRLSYRKIHIAVDNIFEIHIDRLSDPKKLKLANGVKDVIENLSDKGKIDFLKAICKQNGIDFNEIKQSEYYMNKDEIEEIVSHGHLIGAHSMGHENLASMTFPQVKSDIIESKEVINKLSYNRFMPFSYPYGTKKAFNAKIKNLLNENGYSCAVTTLESLNGINSDLFELKRIEIGDFNMPEFISHLSGFIGDVKIILKKLMQRK